MKAELRATFRAGAVALLCSVYSSNITPKIKRLPSIWATEERKLPSETHTLSTRETIPYRHELMPHCVEPMDAVDDPAISKLALWWPIRDGKTLGVCANVIGRTVTDNPGNIYSVHPIDDDAERFSVGDLEPMIDASGLDHYFVPKRSRNPGRTIQFKKYAGGWIRILSAKSVTKFRGTSVQVLLLHELDALDPESIYKAFGRTTGFSNAITIVESTGTLAPTFDQEGKLEYRSNIHREYDQGDQRKWFGPCRRCDHLQYLRKVDEPGVCAIKGFWAPKGKPEKAVYLCEKCEADHNEAQWREFQRNAKWFPTAGLSEKQQTDIAKNFHLAQAIDPTVRSYWRSGFNSLLPTGKGYKTKLHQFMAEADRANRSSPEAKRVWINEVAADLWNPDGEQEQPPDWQKIYERREVYA